jgi:hypothetical protein
VQTHQQFLGLVFREVLKAFRVIERRIRGVLASKDSGRLESWPRRHIIEKEHSVTQAFLPELPVSARALRRAHVSVHGVVCWALMLVLVEP